jgi:MraZ protein
MDAKGRVAIPQVLRLELMPQGEPAPVLTHLLDCPALAMYPHRRWLEIEERVNRMSQVQPEAQMIRRVLISGAEDCAIDGQGRVLVPAHMREFAGLTKNVLIAAVGERIELWDPPRFEQELIKIRAQGDNVSRIAADLGL